MNDIVRRLTPDGFIGYDQFNQLVALEVEKERTTSWILPCNPLEKICCICAHGWDLNHRSVKDQHFWRDRDKVVHMSCYKRYLGLCEWDLFYNSICTLASAWSGLTEVGNLYKGAWNLPWYEFNFKGSPHLITIGRRKRVFHMEIEYRVGGRASSLDVELAEALFKLEDVTKEFGPRHILVHAWTDEKFLEYLRHFERILGLVQTSNVPAVTE